MAAKKLVGSISRPAKIIFLRRPQKSPSINPVYRFLLNSSPNPKRPNPHHDLGFRFPSAKTRPFSTKSESDHLPHWSIEYRRRMGIEDDHLVLIQHPFAIWRPPRDGEIKINFCGTLGGPNFYDAKEGETGAITAIARNSSGDVVGVTAGLMDCKSGNLIEMQLYALKASASLAEELKITGMHDGPVVHESSSQSLVTSRIPDEGIGEPEKVIRRNMPGEEDLEEVGRSCPIYCGTDDKLKEMMPDYLDIIFDLVERDKILAGLQNGHQDEELAFARAGS